MSRRPNPTATPDPETLRLFASILRKPKRSDASCSGQSPAIASSLNSPGEINLAAAAALEFQADMIEAEMAKGQTKHIPAHS